MANINKELNDIKNAVYGKEVRGSIHDGIKKINEEVENTTDRQDSVEAQFQSVLDETTGKDVISAPEINAAKVGADNTDYPNLKQRLDTEHNRLSSQLAHTIERIPNVANASSTLKLLNPYGNYQNIHPKVLYFENGWNGYKFWVAYTPYVRGNTTTENPCIAVSNDGENWGLPEGLESGLLADWNGIENDYNNDTHLVHRDDLDRLEVWWRVAYDNGKAELRRRTSTDGKNWSSVEILFTGTRVGDDHISPAIIWEDGKYKMLSVNTETNYDRTLHYSESTNGTNWTARQEVTVDWGTLTPWHLDFIKVGNKYEMVLQAWDLGENNNTSSLYYLESSDLLNWTKPALILSPTGLPSGFDNRGIYRSSLLKIDDTYFLFYSSVSTNNDRAMALSYGKNINALKGFAENVDGGIKELLLADENVGAKLKPHESIINAVEVLQTTSSEKKHGHLKLGNLFFGDGTTNTTTPDESTIRYNPNFDRYEKYNSRQWAGINTRVWAKLSNAITLPSGQFVDIPFNVVPTNNGKYENGVYSIEYQEYLKITLGLHLNNVGQGGRIEVQIKNANNDNNLQMVYNKEIPEGFGSYYINSTVGTSLNAPFKISVRYLGDSNNVTTTAYEVQNFLLIESY